MVLVLGQPIKGDYANIKSTYLSGVTVVSTEKGTIEVLLAEFSALRDEILQNLSMQWNTFVFQLTTTGIVFSFALTDKSRVGFLLIIPVVSYALGGRFLHGSRAIQEIGIYIRDELSPRVPGGLNWEEWHRKRAYAAPQFAWLSPLPITFPASSLLALAWTAPYILYSTYISTANRWLLGIIWVSSFVLAMMSLYAIIRLKGERLRKIISALNSGSRGSARLHYHLIEVNI